MSAESTQWPAGWPEFPGSQRHSREVVEAWIDDATAHVIAGIEESGELPSTIRISMDAPNWIPTDGVVYVQSGGSRREVHLMLTGVKYGDAVYSLEELNVW